MDSYPDLPNIREHHQHHTQPFYKSIDWELESNASGALHPGITEITYEPNSGAEGSDDIHVLKICVLDRTHVKI